MKAKIIFAIVVLAAVGTGAFFIGRSMGHDHGADSRKTVYTCGMHPQIRQDHPGNCPICGMKLTPIRDQADTAASGAADSSTISVDPATIQTMGIRLGVVSRGPLRRTIRSVGAVDFDETRLTDVTTKFKGWIEKLYVDSTGQQVHKGDPLFEIYSPELYSAQTEFLLALNLTSGSSGSDSLKGSALTKLKFFDVSDEQIAELEKTRQATKTLRINAPRDGIVVEKLATEGQMVEAGMKLYRLADLATVWVQTQVYEQDLPFVELGQEATVSLSYLADRKFRGRITYLYPTLDEKTRTARVRMEFHNPGYFLKPGMFATVEITAELEPSTLLVPDVAILRSGERNTVFVALAGGKFDPRVVTLGPRSDDNRYQVLSGLNEGERVVTSGQFMFDSESQLREAIQKMMKPGTPAAQTEHAAETNTPTASAEQSQAQPAEVPIAAYVCPMPEHVSIKYEHPGKCPLCGMTLIPVAEKTLEKIQPGGRIVYYTCAMTDACPMPGHGNVKYDKPGKCPVCGMTLIPVMESPLPPPAATPEKLSSILYTCPMASHADVVSDKPGDCPKCGMKLVETSTVGHGKIAEENWRKQHANDPALPAHQH